MYRYFASCALFVRSYSLSFLPAVRLQVWSHPCMFLFEFLVLLYGIIYYIILYYMEVSTTSVRLNGAAWGNIRSIVDGELSTTLEDSTGTPVFYLPTPDPTNVDVLHDATIALSFSEASLTERLDPETHTKVCNGLGTCMSWRPSRPVVYPGSVRHDSARRSVSCKTREREHSIVDSRYSQQDTILPFFFSCRSHGSLVWTSHDGRDGGEN